MICRSGFPAKRDYLTKFRDAYLIEEGKQGVETNIQML